MAENEEWKPTNPDDDVWGEMFEDELDRERWRTNFGQDSEAAESASYWRDMLPGVEPSVAAIYKKEGLNPYDVTDYTNAGLQDYKEILGWKRVNAQPEIAAAFKEKGVDAETYAEWSKIGVQDPDMMIRFSEDFKIDIKQLEQFVKPLVDKEMIKINEVPKWLSAGFNVREIEGWVAQGFKYAYVAAGWKSLRFKPEDAAEWSKVLQRPQKAAAWLAGGYKDIKDIEGLIKMGYESPDEISREAEDLVVKV